VKTLRPQPFKIQYAEQTRKGLSRVLYDMLFRELLDSVKAYTAQKALLNANVNALARALRQGRIQYIDGMFVGQFSAPLGRELRAIGATFDKTRKAYKLPPRLLPSDLRAALSFADAQAKVLTDNLRGALKRTEEQLNFKLAKVDVVKPATVKAINADFQKVVEAISIKPQVSAEAQAKIAEEYNDNMKIYIKDFVQAEIKELRDIVEGNAMAGGRYDSLIAGFKERYGVTQNKAKFLARQETALMMSSFRKARFTEMGVKHYRWSAVPSARPDHKALDGKVFAYANPPVTDRATGARNNPGQDFNCRCVDVPIIGE